MYARTLWLVEQNFESLLAAMKDLPQYSHDFPCLPLARSSLILARSSLVLFSLAIAAQSGEQYLMAFFL